MVSQFCCPSPCAGHRASRFGRSLARWVGLLPSHFSLCASMQTAPIILFLKTGYTCGLHAKFIRCAFFIWLAMLAIYHHLLETTTNQFLVHFFMDIENGLLRNIIFKWLGRRLCFRELNLRFRDVRSHPPNAFLQLPGEWKCCRWVAELLGTFRFRGIFNSSLWLQKWRYFVLLNMLIWTRAMRYATF